ncbi:MAG TPA: AtpZ/AtpI family protein [Bacteroidales bacterium]|jgi:F0F1-type ATP synthase assembly protein I|nr:AtpZ/AtpI family protein [Bacteroidales bacterium]
MPEKKPNDQQKISKGLSNYAKYSSLAFQMIAIILVGVFGGIKLDDWLNLKFPIFTVVLSLLATGGAMYYGIKDFIRMK